MHAASRSTRCIALYHASVFHVGQAECTDHVAHELPHTRSGTHCNCATAGLERCLHLKCACADKLTLSPGDEGYQDQLDAAVDKLLDRMEQELRGLYERHRHSMPGWEKRPLVIR